MTQMQARGSRLLTGILILFLLANLAGMFYLARRLQQQEGRLQQMRQALDLYRWERTDEYGGLGLNALLSHLLHWAPKLQAADPASGDHAMIQQKVENIIEAMGALGPDIYPLVERSFLEGGPATGEASTSDEVRKWLATAALEVDPLRGKALAARILRADPKDLLVSSRLRWWAAGELTKLDKALAGDILHQILTTESASGAGRLTDPGKTRGRRQPGFSNFISYYVATGHAKIEETLIMILGRSEHDLMTIKKCVDELGQMKSRAAADKIMELYWQAPSGGPDPLLRRKCMDAAARILGKESCDFLRKINSSESDLGIRKRLVELLKQYCPS